MMCSTQGVRGKLVALQGKSWAADQLWLSGCGEYFLRFLEVLAAGAAVVGRNECSYGKR